MAGARRRVAGYIRILNKEPQKARIRTALIRTLLVDLDAPAEARAYLTDDVDQELRTYVPLAARPVSELPAAAAREVGDWYLKKLAPTASPHATPALLARASACYRQVLDLVPGDLPAKITLGQITRRMEKLGFRSAIVSRRPPKTQAPRPHATTPKAPPAGTSTSLADLPKVVAPLGVSVLLSTGRSCAGTIFRCETDRLFLRVNGQMESCYRANIVDLTLQLPEPDQQKLARLRAAWQDLAVGRILLDHKFPGLAEVEFIQAVRREPPIAEEVRRAYSDAEVALPESLGGPASGDGEERGQARRYPLPTPAQIRFATTRADELAAKMKKIAPATHAIQTEHYRVFSAWSRREDAKLKEIYEKLYRALCKQFMIRPWEHIFIGRLPVYAFWTKDNYVRFCVEVLRVPLATAKRSGGLMFHAGLGDHRERFLVLGPAYLAKGMPKSQAKTWFYEVLVHESTHAFTGRFINENSIANWVDEGISEIMAATLVPGSCASEKWKAATRQVRREGTPVTGIFRGGNIPLDAFHYGIAQSMVRFLYDRDRRKFLQFVKLMKEGKSDREALEEAYGLTQRTLVAAWKRAIR